MSQIFVHNIWIAAKLESFSWDTSASTQKMCFTTLLLKRLKHPGSAKYFMLCEFPLQNIHNSISLSRCTSLVWWLACLTAIQEVPGLIPSYTLQFFLEVWVWNGVYPASWCRLGSYCLRSSKTLIRKLKLRLRDKVLLTTRPPALPAGSNCFSRS